MRFTICDFRFGSPDAPGARSWELEAGIAGAGRRLLVCLLCRVEPCSGLFRPPSGTRKGLACHVRLRPRDARIRRVRFPTGSRRFSLPGWLCCGPACKNRLSRKRNPSWTDVPRRPFESIRILLEMCRAAVAVRDHPRLPRDAHGGRRCSSARGPVGRRLVVRPEAER